ncbi:hypothetical protein MX652_15065 [Thauera aromatica]|nr:hypothetical protein [Thauera aromatica]MCK2128004.1 hypothetical protein [Thauera aromatica]
MSTPYIAGPWGHDRRVIFADGAAIAEVFSGACRSLAEADATERLIAAAPELHQALAEILGDYRNDLAVIRPHTLKLIVSALAKVGGAA